MTYQNRPVSTVREIYQWIQAILLAVIIAFIIRGFIFEPVYVDGESMENTLTTGQRLIVNKLGYYFSPPKRGEIIVLQYQEGAVRFLPFLENMPFVKKVIPDLQEIDFIKRVIGVPGDTVNIKDGYVYINNVKLDEPYVKGITEKQIIDFPVKIPRNKVLVMGDNRQNSRDSRHIGLIDYDRIKGRAVFRIWPFRDFGLLK